MTGTANMMLADVELFVLLIMAIKLAEYLNPAKKLAFLGFPSVSRQRDILAAF